MHRTTVLIPDSLRARIDKKANELGLSMGELLRLAVSDYLDRDQQLLQADPMAGSAFVLREPGPADVSANVDRYLYGDRA